MLVKFWDEVVQFDILSLILDASSFYKIKKKRMCYAPKGHVED